MTDTRKPIDRLITKKQAEIDTLRREVEAAQLRLTTAEAQLETLELVIAALSRSQPSTKGEPLGLKPGSVMDKAYQHIKSVGHPVHIREIISGIGLEYNDQNNRVVSSQLNVYVKKGRYFTRPAPSTFGITEFGGDSE